MPPLPTAQQLVVEVAAPPDGMPRRPNAGGTFTTGRRGDRTEPGSRAAVLRPEPGTETVMDEKALYSERHAIVGDDFEHGGEAAARIKATMKEFGIDPGAIRRLSIANFEAEMNVIMYADSGELVFSVTPEAASVVVSDRGPGIPDVGLAMQEGYSTATAEMRARGFGAGMGLPNIRRSTDWFSIESTPGVGTTLRYGVRIGESQGGNK